ncbi:MAG: phosphatase PAP2 family protein [Pseudolysinimonas sp.]
MTDAPLKHRPARRDLAALGAGIGGVLVVAVGGLLIDLMAGGSPLAVDSAWAREMTADRGATGIAVAMALADVGGTLVAWLLVGVLTVVLLVVRRWTIAVALVLTLSLSSVASSLLKLAVGRPRPGGGVMHLASFSYPSGHATIAATLMTLVLAVPRAWARTLAVVWVVAIAWSRTYLGVHWLSDVVAGVVLGASVALLATGAVALVVARHSRSNAGANAPGRTG